MTWPETIEWDDVWQGFVMLLVLILLVFVIVVVYGLTLASHDIEYYYISADNNSPVSCVYAYRNWSPNEKAYCSPNKDELIDFLTKANQNLPKAKQ